MEILKELLEEVDKLLVNARSDASNRVGSASRIVKRHQAEGRRDALSDVKKLIEARIDDETKKETEEKSEEKKKDGGD